jgi:hypothetical protein
VLSSNEYKPDGPWARCFSVRKKSFQRCNPSFCALLRAGLANAWQKFLNKEGLDPLETQLTQVIEMHPEYHALINNVELDYFPEQGIIK